jgi:hypothetical protein
MARGVEKPRRSDGQGPDRDDPASASGDLAAWIPDKLASITDLTSRRRAEAEPERDARPSTENGVGEWLPDGIQPAAPREESFDANGDSGAQFVPDGLPPRASPQSNPVRPAPPEPIQAEPEPAEPTQAEAALARAEERLRETERVLREAEGRAREAEERGERLSTDLEALQRKVEQHARQVEIAERRAAARPNARPSPPPAPARELPPRPKPPEGKIDVNRASFETLRSLGLSVSQTARLVGQRDQAGGFRSIVDLDAVWGLPRDLVEVLKQRSVF